MGRYSSVQAYADNNANMRSVSYQQATGSAEVKKGAVKAEKVSNPYGSTAGAGSGEFHVYRHARARELERWRTLEEQEKLQKMQHEYQEKIDQYKTEEETRTDKRRKKRQRQKEAKLRKKNLELSGVTSSSLAKNDIPEPAQQDDDEEFTYTSLEQVKEDSKPSANESKDENQPNLPIRNDGSFLEMMKKQLANGAVAEEEKKAGSDGKSEDEEQKPPSKRQAT